MAAHTQIHRQYDVVLAYSLEHRKKKKMKKIGTTQQLLHTVHNLFGEVYGVLHHAGLAIINRQRAVQSLGSVCPYIGDLPFITLQLSWRQARGVNLL